MKARLQRGEPAEKVRFDTLEPGDWFIDRVGDLCVKTDEDERNTYDVSNDQLMELDADDLVTPVQVTISF